MTIDAFDTDRGTLHRKLRALFLIANREPIREAVAIYGDTLLPHAGPELWATLNEAMIKGKLPAPADILDEVKAKRLVKQRAERDSQRLADLEAAAANAHTPEAKEAAKKFFASMREIFDDEKTQPDATGT